MVVKQKTIIGRVATGDFPADGSSHIPVKIDTGADSSSVWASQISIDAEGVLRFVLFDEQSPHYTGKKHVTRHYTARLIRSSNGLTQVRYSVKLAIVLEGRTLRGTFTLADRSLNNYPVLVGCRLLKNKFLVDVAKGKVIPSTHAHLNLQGELQDDPRAFYEKYHLNNERGDIEL